MAVSSTFAIVIQKNVQIEQTARVTVRPRTCMSQLVITTLINSFKPRLICPLSRLLFVLTQGFEIGERLVGIRSLRLIPHRRIPACLPIQGSRVLAVVAIHAQELPVAAVGGIIIVVAVFMMDRQLVKLFAGKFSSAPGAYPGQDLERLIAVNIPPPFPKLPRSRNYMLQRIAF